MKTNHRYSIGCMAVLLVVVLLFYTMLVSAARSQGVRIASRAPQAEVTLILDDGTHSGVVGILNTNGTAKQFLWINRFTPDPALFPFFLHEIWVLFDGRGSAYNVHIGDAIELVVYMDTDGNPANGATVLATYPETIQVVDGNAWSQYHLPTPLPLTTPGDVLIGVVNRYTVDGVSTTTYPAAYDTTTNLGRSWWGWWEGAVPEPPVLPPDNTFALYAGNWMIRAYGSTESIDETETPTPTVTRTPTTLGQFLSVIIHHIPPTFTPTPTATATPALAQVYIDNDTGGRLCYEVVNSGVGKKCSSEGEFYYGSFQPGTYTRKASARCGSASGTRNYGVGRTTHRFWCIGTLQNQP